MKICNNKKYRTRSGLKVVIDRKRSGYKYYSVTGRVYETNGHVRLLHWSAFGKYFYFGSKEEHPYDLIEVVND